MLLSIIQLRGIQKDAILWSTAISTLGSVAFTYVRKTKPLMAWKQTLFQTCSANLSLSSTTSPELFAYTVDGFILGNKADVDALDSDERTVLHRAVENGTRHWLVYWWGYQLLMLRIAIDARRWTKRLKKGRGSSSARDGARCWC